MFKKSTFLSVICLLMFGFSNSSWAVTCQSGYVAYNNACYAKLECKNGGMQQGDKCVCAAGWKGKTCSSKNTCAYKTTKCGTGYVATGNTCQSGNNKYVECKAKECKGYNYTTCPTGYVKSSQCTSGTVKKLKCNSCADGYVKYDGKCYAKLECKNGGIQQADKCVCAAGWKGKTCSSKNTCAYTTKSCGTGYVATGNTCQSGNNKYVECKAKECKGYNYTTCPTGYVKSSQCTSGKVKKLKCNSCADGYVKYDGKCYAKLECKNGGTQQGDKCVCAAGWKGKTCSSKNTCAYKTKKCGTGYVATGNTCQSGSNKYVECKAKECKGYDYTTCPTGYVETASCMSGSTKKLKCENCVSGYVKYDGKCYAKLECKNGGTQQGDKCSCPEGWTGTTCNTKATCAYNTVSCTGGYEETGNTCKSGDTTYKECKAKTVPEGYTKDKCGEGYKQVATFLSGTTTYYKCEINDCSSYQTECGASYDKVESCLSGTIQYYTCTPKKVPEGYTATACGSGYTQVDTFLSGTTTYYKCEANDCSAYQTECGEGYDKAQSCLSGTTPYYTCTEKPVPEGYTTTKCNAGYEQAEFLSGTTTYYKCTLRDCSAYQADCGEGYNKVESCLSGTTQYYTCTPKGVPEGYSISECGEGYTQKDTMTSGTTQYYLCEATDCSAYLKDCGEGYDKTQSCLSGTTPYYTCTEKPVPEGYTTTACGEGYEQAEFLSGTTTYYKCTLRDCSAYQTNCGASYDKVESCLSGTTQYYTCTPKEVPSGYAETPCGAGYTQVDTFISGDKTYYKCEANDCSGYQADCGEGYDKIQSCLSGTTPYYICTEKVVPEGYTISECGSGYTLKGTFISGTTPYYLCEATDCSDYEISCGEGYDANEACLSGTTPYYICTPREVPSGYAETPCGEGYTQVDTFLSGNKIYYKCEANKCDGFEYTECPDGYTPSDICYRGETPMYKCAENTCDGFEYTECPDGLKISAVCKKGKTPMYKCDDCNEGYIKQDDECYKIIECLHGGVQNGSQCVCPTGWEGAYCHIATSCPYDTTSCEDGYEETGVTCKSGDTLYKQCREKTCPYLTTSCADGYIVTGNTCKSGKMTYIECVKNNNCEGYPLSSSPSNCQTIEQCQTTQNATKYRCAKCKTGYKHNGSGECVKLSTPVVLQSSDVNNSKKTLNNNEYRNIYGMNNSSNDLYNALSYNGAELNITNHSDGGVYGINADYARNSYTLDNISDAAITINNTGDGTIYGMYGISGVVNAQTKSGYATGDITINNIGNGDIYGMKTMFTEFNESQVVSDILTKNAESETGYAFATITVDNVGNGVVRGIDAGSTGVNALSGSGTAEAVIDIKNKGSKNVYGMYAEYLVQNVTANRSEATAEIDIENVGDGNVYGIYSNGYAHNAAGYSEAETYGLIDIKNRGNGDVTAITSADTRDTSNLNGNYYYFSDVISYHLYNARANNASATAEINIENEGDGNISAFDTIINNNDTFAQYAGNMTYSTYAINNGTAESKINIKNESSDTNQKDINISKRTLVLAYAEKNSTAKNDINIDTNGDSYITLAKLGKGKKKVKVKVIDENGNEREIEEEVDIEYITAKDNSTADTSIVVHKIGDGLIELPITAEVSGNSTVKNSIDVTNVGADDVQLSFKAFPSNAKEVSSTIKLQNKGNGDVNVDNNFGDGVTLFNLIKNYLRNHDNKDVNIDEEIKTSSKITKVANEGNGDINITGYVGSKTKNGTINNEVSVDSIGTGEVNISDLIIVTDNNTANSSAIVRKKGDNDLNYEMFAVANNNSTINSLIDVVNEGMNDILLSFETYKSSAVQSTIRLKNKGDGSITVVNSGCSSQTTEVSNVGNGNISIIGGNGTTKVDNAGIGNIGISGDLQQVIVNKNGEKGNIVIGGFGGSAEITNRSSVVETITISVSGDNRAVTIDNLGTSNISVSGSNTVDNIETNIQNRGNGNITVTGDRRMLRLNTIGDGNIKLAGNRGNAVITNEGDGNVEISGYNNTVKLTNHGTGSITLGCDDNRACAYAALSAGISAAVSSIELNLFGNSSLLMPANYLAYADGAKASNYLTINRTDNNQALNLNNLQLYAGNDGSVSNAIEINNINSGNIDLSLNAETAEEATLNNTLEIHNLGDNSVNFIYASAGENIQNTVNIENTGDGVVSVSGDYQKIQIANVGDGAITVSGNSKTLNLSAEGNSRIEVTGNSGYNDITARGTGKLIINGSDESFIKNDGKDISDYTSGARTKIINRGNGHIYSTNDDAIIKNLYNGELNVDSVGLLIHQGSGSIHNANSALRIINLASGKVYDVNEITNIGTGLAVGRYIQNGTVENDEDIQIHNLGTGTAVGIYVESFVSLTNNGNIIIDRESFEGKDLLEDGTVKDITYSAEELIGGNAVGIYGAKNSTIINNGDITITGAATAYGIYSEGGTVTNTGTITLDDTQCNNDNCSNKKAIRLNSGTLLQNGVLKKGVDFANPGCAEGYIEYEGVCYVDLNCQNNHAHQVENSCVCNEGYIEYEGICYVDLNCQNNHAHQVENNCVCDNGYIRFTRDDGTYVCNAKLKCVNGGTQNINGCQCPEGWTGTLCEEPASCDGFEYETCPTGYVSSGTCKSGRRIMNACENCADGYEKDIEDGKCYEVLPCVNGESKKGVCQCVEGWVGLLCDEPALCDGFEYETCPTGYVSSGTCKSGDKIMNACENCAEGYAKDSEDGKCYEVLPCANGESKKGVCQCAEGWVGLLCEDPAPCDGFEYETCPTGYASSGTCKSGDKMMNKCERCANGYVKFSTLGDGICYKKRNCGKTGTQLGNECICQDGYMKSADGTCLSYASREPNNENLNLTYSGSDEAAGVIAEENLPYNAYNAKDGGTGNIKIVNTNNGTMYGVTDWNYNTNVYNASGEGSVGHIIAENIDSGTIYGIEGHNAYNASDMGEGHINITNLGTGKAYGVFAMSYAGNANANSSGYVTILNRNIGSVYGVAGRMGVHNLSDGNRESVIEIANIDNGLAVGLLSYGTAKNSGEIKIHNLGTGVAVGIFVDEDSTVENSGSITIDRESFTQNGVTYSAEGAGGQAIGIYGASRSIIKNTGTIIINGAATAYGIWNKGGDVYNAGTILIDGAYSENAIRLNAGDIMYNNGTIRTTNWSANGETGIYPPDCVHGAPVGNVCICETGWGGNDCGTAKSCPSGYYTSCGEGFVQTGEACYSGDTPMYQCEDIVSDLVGTTNIKNNSEINLTNIYNRDVYGIKAEDSGAYNAYGSSTAEAVGTITIENSAEGNVYGVENSSGSAYNAISYGFEADGTITIINSGTGNVYGIKSESNNAYNAYTSSGGATIASITIDNSADGDVYGVVSSADGSVDNVGAYSGNANGNISIRNRANGNVYGIVGKYATNVFAYNEGTHAEGHIFINNSGSGEVYGLKGDSSVYNAFGDEKAYAEGDVVIISGGTYTYGLHGGQAENRSNEYKTSTIEIANTGNGLAVGMYTTIGSARNSGEIKIHNLGNGIAVGIMADGTASATNSGVITIDRESFTKGDEVWSETTSADDMAIGIYGGAASNITNSGTITINNASYAYGIYSEGGRVTNTGTINIDGTQCTGDDCNQDSNAIKLNRGTLFQNGKLAATTNPESCAEGYIMYDGICYQDEHCTKDNMHQYKDNCVCDDGYIDYYGSCYLDKHCVHGTQKGNSCQCDEGWVSADCSVERSCDGYQEDRCGEFYNETVCYSGDTPKYSCKLKAEYIVGDDGNIYERKECIHGQQVNAVCACNTGYAGENCSEIAEGYIEDDGKIYAQLECAEHEHQSKDQCVCDSGYTAFDDGCYATLSCPAHSSQYKDECVCATGYVKQDGACYRELTCGENSEQVHNECVCDEGYVRQYNACYEILTCPAHSRQVRNECVCDSGYVMYEGQCYVSQNCSGNRTQVEDRCECKSGYIEQDGECYRKKSCPRNASQLHDECVCNDGYINQDGQCYLIIPCENGEQVHDRCVCHDDYLLIDGVCQYVGLTSNSNNSDITLENNSDNDVYGMYANSIISLHNALTESTSTDMMEGSINITNGGAGSSYGMYQGGDDTSFNAYGSSSLVAARGIISILNSGSGDAYGMYAPSGGIRNAYTQSNGIAVGIINIVNQSTGNVYGMFGKNVYNEGLSNPKSSTIEIANTGDGLAVGIYSKDGTASNTGNIKIHNLGEGVAIGIMADGTTNVTNSGKIIIDRESFHDYTADNAIGGVAIGIYGASGSTIKNTGTITINAASNAYGIWSEGGNVTNIGTINIDNTSCKGEDCHQTTNAIVLNGGQLFQNGKLSKEADFAVCAEGYIMQNGVCYAQLTCQENATQRGEQCVCNSGYVMYSGTCYVDINCGANMTQVQNQCVCNNGYVMYNGTCYVDANCGANMTQVQNQCICNDGYGLKDGACIATGVNNKNTTIESNDSQDVYGMFSSSYYMFNAKADEANTIAAEININNAEGGNVYGMYQNGRYSITYNSYASASGSIAEGTIRLTNSGAGNVYGIYSPQFDIYNAYAQNEGSSVGIIDIVNNANGNVYGMHGGNDNTISNARLDNSDSSASGLIRITNNGDGYAYGMYGDGYIYNASSSSATGSSEGIINIINNGRGKSYGMFGKNTYNDSSEQVASTIEVINTCDGLAVGMYAKDGYAYNFGEIKIHNLGSGVAVGIMVEGKAGVFNSGTITIDRENFTYNDETYSASESDSDMAIGIYSEGGNVSNYGTIIINGAETAYGIYSEGGNVSNSGTIIIDGISCTGDECTSANHAIELNGGKLFQNGELYVADGALETQSAGAIVAPQKAGAAELPTSYVPQRKAASLNLDDFGGTVVASETAQFVVEGALSGNLALNSSIVENGFNTTYTVAGMIDAEDVSGLHLSSQSALFDASLENGSDAVMTMKSFNDVVKNQSVADFLEQNYAAENNEELFGLLKSKETVAALNSTLNSLIGNEVFNRFNFEDMTLMRELNMDVNNKLFNDKQDYLTTSGYIAPFYFDSESGADGKYALYNHRIGKKSFGLSLAFSNINSSDRHNDNTRKDESFQMSVPFGYKTHGFKFITAPRFGYAYGHYDRDGFESRTYKGTMEKRMFGLMNEARYPVDMGGWNLAPAAEFNMLGYHLKGAEDAAPYALTIKSQNNYSVEAGLGLYADKELKPTKDSTLKLNAGVVMYHEFADPYTMELGMQGMNGSFKVRDERRKDNRAVVRTGFDYSMGDITLEGSFATFVDGTTHTKAGLDFKYNF